MQWLYPGRLAAGKQDIIKADPFIEQRIGFLYVKFL
jgi:hypothetical protein